MSQNIQDLVGMTIICIVLSLACAALSVLVSATADRAWPDRDTIVGLTKIAFGIGVVGMLMFLFFKYLWMSLPGSSLHGSGHMLMNFNRPPTLRALVPG